MRVGLSPSQRPGRVPARAAARHPQVFEYLSSRNEPFPSLASCSSPGRRARGSDKALPMTMGRIIIPVYILNLKASGFRKKSLRYARWRSHPPRPQARIRPGSRACGRREAAARWENVQAVMR
jgi:hypothetical protein